MTNKGDLNNVYIFAAIALLILLIAVVNYMNLATARSIDRAKEVGMRKVVGAPRSQLMAQFLSESVLTTCLALLLAACGGSEESRVAVVGDQVRVHYHGTLDSGEVFDSSQGREPLAFEVGSGLMIAGFDAAVRGLAGTLDRHAIVEAVPIVMQ